MITATRTNWITYSGWAIADQALFALTNVILNVLLARWLSPAHYGAFAVAYSVFLLIGACHAALLIEPMLVFSSRRYATQWADYLDLLLKGNHLLATLASLGLAAAGVCSWLFGSRALGGALLGMAAAGPFVLFMWLVKRACYVNHKTRLAAAQSLIYLTFTLGGLLFLKSAQLLSLFSAMLVVSIASAFAGLWLTNKLRAVERTNQPRLHRQDVVRTHWVYGRWALMTNILLWLSINFYVLALSIWSSLEISARLKAVTNLAFPLMQANAALSAAVLPVLVVSSANGSQFRRVVYRAVGFFAALGAFYGIAIGLFGSPLIKLLYRGNYDASIKMMWLVALIPLFDGLTAVLSSTLRSLEQPRRVFLAQVSAAVCAVSFGIVATRTWGVAGAIGAMVFASGLAVLVLAFSAWRCVTANVDRLDEQTCPPSERETYCDLCKEAGILYGKAKDYDLLSCPRCDLLWTNPLTTSERWASGECSYPGEEVYASNAIAQKQRFSAQLQTFFDVCGVTDPKSLRVLEVGSGLGFFLDTCEKFGIPAEGCDIAERAVQLAHKKRRRIRLGTLDDSYISESFDAIFAFNLIEHLAHPKEFLDHAHRILKPGGTLVLETPIQEGLFHRVARLGHRLSRGRLNFYGMRPSGHIYKFSKKTFAIDNGFRRIYQRNIESPFREIWGNSSIFTFDNKFLYRSALPIVWLVAKLSGQGNRLFVILRKNAEPKYGLGNSFSLGGASCR
jgi:O-antigen/teichoic acid export membrane protein/2-polyprenyl-3-methyl-5-hydroxy-6-metoxy-1,4-benzoquinol methylase